MENRHALILHEAVVNYQARQTAYLTAQRRWFTCLAKVSGARTASVETERGLTLEHRARLAFRAEPLPAFSGREAARRVLGGGSE
jgi:hypothetical protein